MIRLILGGERCGKSNFALKWLLEDPGPHALVVTGRALDLDFRQRIAAHKDARPQDLPVYEAGADLPQVLRRLADAPAVQEAAQALTHESGGAKRLAPVGAESNMIAERPAPVGALLVDSLDFWLFNVLEKGLDPDNAAQDLTDALKAARCHVSLVSCEIGLGPTPATQEARRFVRHLGALNQAVAAASQEVCLVAAGCPLYLKR